MPAASASLEGPWCSTVAMRTVLLSCSWYMRKALDNWDSRACFSSTCLLVDWRWLGWNTFHVTGYCCYNSMQVIRLSCCAMLWMKLQNCKLDILAWIRVAYHNTSLGKQHTCDVARIADHTLQTSTLQQLHSPLTSRQQTSQGFFLCCQSFLHLRTREMGRYCTAGFVSSRLMPPSKPAMPHVAHQNKHAFLVAAVRFFMQEQGKQVPAAASYEPLLPHWPGSPPKAALSGWRSVTACQTVHCATLYALVQGHSEPSLFWLWLDASTRDLCWDGYPCDGSWRSWHLQKVPADWANTRLLAAVAAAVAAADQGCHKFLYLTTQTLQKQAASTVAPPSYVDSTAGEGKGHVLVRVSHIQMGMAYSISR